MLNRGNGRRLRFRKEAGSLAFYNALLRPGSGILSDCWRGVSTDEFRAGIGVQVTKAGGLPWRGTGVPPVFGRPHGRDDHATLTARLGSPSGVTGQCPSSRSASSRSAVAGSGGWGVGSRAGGEW